MNFVAADKRAKQLSLDIGDDVYIIIWAGKYRIVSQHGRLGYGNYRKDIALYRNGGLIEHYIKNSDNFLWKEYRK